MHATQFERRYDVDWLRTLAFGLLILYHIGQYYVFDWEWHIKSETQSVWLQDLMILSNQWRMSLLFFVSGMTLALIESRYSTSSLLRTRFMRLFIPLLFGMYVIVPPQLYFELQQNAGYTGDYWQFYQQYLDVNTELAPHKRTPAGLLTWNHLWYLAYLWVYTFAFLAIRPLLNLLTRTKLFGSISAIGAMAIVVTTVLVAWFFLRQSFPTTHALFDDWYNHAKYFSVLIFGYLLVHRADIWQQLINRRRALLVVACITYSLIILNRHDMFESLAAMYSTSDIVRLFYGLVLGINMWCWLLVMVGYAGRYLNRPAKLLSYANQAVLPWYILHQTLIILFAMMLKGFGLPVGLEAGLLVILTVSGCLIGYEMIRRIYMLNLLFGIKNSHRTKVFQQKISGYTG